MERDNKLGLALIGSFIVVGAILAFLLVTLIGGGKIGSDQQQMVSYFTGTVKGLNVGAQVSFRGARIGNVAEIGLLYNEANDTVAIPVVMTIDRAALGNLREIGDSMQEGLATRLISRGLRSQLALESIVTGQLYVQLDFHPESEAKFYKEHPPYPEIPTMPSKLEILQQKLEGIPLDRIAQSLERSLAGVESVVNSDDTKQTIRSFNEAAKQSAILATNLSQLTEESGPKLTRAIESADRAASSWAKIGSDSESTARDLKRLSPKIEELVDEASRTVRSIKKLSDTIERQPESILKGKK